MSDDARLMVSLEARIDKLQASLSKANQLTAGWAVQTQKHVDEANAGWGKLFQRGDPGKAIEAVFSRSRLALLDEGGARLGIFGSALEDLGGTGLVAAGGIAAAAVAIEKAKQASEWASGLEKTAKALALSTTQLQEFQYGAKQSDVSTEALNGGLEALQVALGRAQNGGKGAAKTLQAFQQLGFTQAQLRGYSSVGDLVPDLGEKFATMGDQAQKAAIASRIGVEGMLPYLQQGKSGISNLSDEAERYGVVVDENLVQRGADAHAELARMGDEINANLTTAFLRLTPLVLEAGGAFVTASSYFGQFVKGLVDSWPQIEQTGREIAYLLNAANQYANAKSGQGNNQHLDFFGRRQDGSSPYTDPGTNLEWLLRAPLGHGVTPQTVAQSAAAKAEALRQREVANRLTLQPGPVDLSGLGSRDAVYTPPPPKFDPHVQGAPTRGRTKKPPEDRSDQLVDQAKKAYADALVQAAAAQLSAVTFQIEQDDKTAAGRERLASDIDARTAIERQELQAETDAKNATLDKEQAELASAIKKHQITGLAAQEAQRDIDRARTQILQTQAEKSALITQQAIADKLQAALAERQRQLQLEQDLTGEAGKVASIEGELARTTAQRLSVAMTQLQRQQSDERDALSNQLSSGAISSEEYNQRLGAMSTRQQAELLQVAHANLTPLQEWTDKSLQSADEVKEAYQKVAADGLDQLGDGLASVITGTESVTDAFKQMVQSILAELLKIEIRQAILQPLEKMLFGPQIALTPMTPIALGSDSIPLTGGASITPSDLSTVLSGLPGRAGGGPVSAGQPYLVGEHGRELFTPNVGGTIVPNLGNMPSVLRAGATQIIVQVQANDYFDAQVEKVAGPLAARTAVQAATRAAQAGAALGQQQLQGRMRRQMS